jgi:hypothetical protein
MTVSGAAVPFTPFIPAQAGIQYFLTPVFVALGPRFRGDERVV